MTYDDVMSLAKWAGLPKELEGLKRMVFTAERLCIPNALQPLLTFRLSDLSPTQLQCEFTLPSASVGLDLDCSAIFLQDSCLDQLGIHGKRVFLECWPMIRVRHGEQQDQNSNREQRSRLTGFAFMYGEIKTVTVLSNRPIESEIQGKGIVHWFGTWFPLEEKLDMIFGEGIPQADIDKSRAVVFGALKQLAYMQFQSNGGDPATI